MKVLILKPSSLGDVVQALPVLRLIKRHHPAAQVWWWIEGANAPLLEGDPDLAGLIRFERHRWTSMWHWDEVVHSLREIRAHRFDWVIDLQSLARSAAVAWLANGGFTVGLDDRREWIHGGYDVAVPRPSFHSHAVDWYLSVLPALGVPVVREFDWLPPRMSVAAAVEARWHPGQTGARWILLQPGARWTNKRWPVEYFAETVRGLAAADSRVRFGILGGPGDQDLAVSITAAAPARCLNLAGETSLAEMIEWIRLGELMITNDTGPMHVAAALGKPVIALFGPTEPARTGPYGQTAHVLQRRELPCVPCLKSECHHAEPLACLRRLSSTEVVAAARKILVI